MDRLSTLARIRTALGARFDIASYAFEPDGRTITLRGRPAASLQELRAVLAPLGYAVEAHPGPLVVLTLTQAELGAPDAPPAAPAPPLIARLADLPRWVPPVLFGLTALSIFVTGSLQQGETPDQVKFVPLDGLMLAAALLAILGAHELGHWVVARRHGERPSLPLFIPFPMSLLGTLGAVIVQREPFKNRRVLLEVALAGPLCGLVVAVPLLVVGLLLSEIKPVPPPGTPGLIMMGDSIATRLIGMVRPVDVSQGVDLFLHPIGFAAWMGLLITGINLLPAGQLDGGHIAHALLGARARYLSWAVIVGMFVLAAFVSREWGLWALMLALWGGSHPPLKDETLPLQRRHWLMAGLALVMLVMVFVPQPIIQ